MKPIFFITAFCCMLMLSSCTKSLTPFTQNLYEENEWSEDELKQIQFYLSRDITIYRHKSEANSAIEDGEIKMVRGKNVEEITIPEGTPGLLTLLPKENRFAISFEDGDNKHLTFGPNPHYGDKYTLLASEWQKNIGTVTYNGEKIFYQIRKCQRFLMVDLKKIDKFNIDKRIAKGRKLN